VIISVLAGFCTIVQAPGGRVREAAEVTQRRTLIAVVVLLVAGALGVGMQIAEPLLGLPNSISALGAPWLVCAFAVGTVVARRAMAVAAGAVLLTSATGLYYAALVFGYGGSALEYATTMALAWSVAASFAGGTMALMGSLWRDATGSRAVVLGALPAAALAGEAVLLAVTWGGAGVALAAELVLAAVLLCVLTWKRAPLPPAVLATIVLGVGFAGLEAEVRDVMRAAGWHGA
jgi:hypothetical protein